MKKLLIALLLATTVASAQDIPTLLKQVGDGYSALQVTNSALSKKVDSLNAIINKPIVTPPPPIVNDYTKTYRYSLAQNAYKFGLLPRGTVTTIPASKGKVAMNYFGTSNPTLGMPYITKDGLLFLQNQANIPYTANISDKPNYPTEVWFVWYKPDYFMWEKYTEEPFYTGDMGGSNGFRFTNDGTDNHQFAKSIQPVNRPAIYRIRATQIGNKTDYINVELWIDGVKQTNNVGVTAWYRKYFTLEVGAQTNNAYVGWAEIFNTPVLTDDQAAKITQELQAEYKPYNLPIATNLTYSVKNGNVTVGYTYTGQQPENVAGVKVRWVDWQGGGPETSIYRTDLDGKLTVPANFHGRAEVTVIDVKGNYFDIPSTKEFKP